MRTFRKTLDRVYQGRPGVLFHIGAAHAVRCRGASDTGGRKKPWGTWTSEGRLRGGCRRDPGRRHPPSSSARAAARVPNSSHPRAGAWFRGSGPVSTSFLRSWVRPSLRPFHPAAGPRPGPTGPACRREGVPNSSDSCLSARFRRLRPRISRAFEELGPRCRRTLPGALVVAAGNCSGSGGGEPGGELRVARGGADAYRTPSLRATEAGFGGLLPGSAELLRS